MRGQFIDLFDNSLIHRTLVITGANLAYFITESVATDNTGEVNDEISKANHCTYVNAACGSLGSSRPRTRHSSVTGSGWCCCHRREIYEEKEIESN